MSEQRNVNKTKWTRFKHLEHFKILLFTFTQSCSLKNIKQKKVSKVKILIEIFFKITSNKSISYFWVSEQRKVNRRKWTRLEHLELFKSILFTFTQSCLLKNSKQKKVNKIQILREFYLNYIKQINFLFMSEWTEESEQRKVNKI